MGDPGLKSKFVASQQEDYFAPVYVENPQVDSTRRGLLMDRARILAELDCVVHQYRRRSLEAALRDIEQQLR